MKKKPYDLSGTPIHSLMGSTALTEQNESSLISLPIFLGLVAGVAGVAYLYRTLTAEEDPVGIVEEDPDPIPEEALPKPDISVVQSQSPIGDKAPPMKSEEESKSTFSWLASKIEALVNFGRETKGPTEEKTPPPRDPSSTKEPTSKPVKKAPQGTFEMKTPSSSLEREKTLLSRGRFSDKEAKWIRKLAESGASVGATIGKPMLPFIKSLIIKKAKEHGLDPQQMLRVASIESGGNPNAISSTGAVGIFQFTSGAASDFGLTNRFDPEANIEAGMLLTKRNIRSLERANVKDRGSALAIYLAHQIGAGGAREVLSVPPSTPIAKLSSGTRKNISYNIGGKSKTVGQYLEANRKALETRYEGQRVAEAAPSVTNLAEAPIYPDSEPTSPPPTSVASSSPTTPTLVPTISVAKTEPASPLPRTSVAKSAPQPPDRSFSPKDNPVALVASAGTPNPSASMAAPMLSGVASSRQPSIESLIRLPSGMTASLS